MPASGQATPWEVCQISAISHLAYERRTNMTRLHLRMIGIVLSLSVGVLAPDQGHAEGDPPKCNLATLKGRYLFGGIATIFPPVPGDPSLLAVAGYHIFNGDGTGKDVLSATINGQSIEQQFSNPDRSEYNITYTVNPDCSGTYTVPAAGVSFGLFVAPDGGEVIVIGLTPGFTLVQGPNRRVSPK